MKELENLPFPENLYADLNAAITCDCSTGDLLINNLLIPRGE